MNDEITTLNYELCRFKKLLQQSIQILQAAIINKVRVLKSIRQQKRKQISCRSPVIAFIQPLIQFLDPLQNTCEGRAALEISTLVLESESVIGLVPILTEGPGTLNSHDFQNQRTARLVARERV